MTITNTSLTCNHSSDCLVATSSHVKGLVRKRLSTLWHSKWSLLFYRSDLHASLKLSFFAIIYDVFKKYYRAVILLIPNLMAAAAILNLTKMLFWALMTLIWPMSIYIPNFTHISSLVTEIWRTNINPRWQLLPLLPERDYVTFGSLLSQIRLSVVCLQRSCALLRSLNFSAIFLRHCVP